MDNKIIHFTFRVNLGREQALKWPKASARQVITVFEHVLSTWVNEQGSKEAKTRASCTLDLYREDLKKRKQL